ncbi:MAG: hypothetical protein AAGK57_02000 [Pseudomonadota bacterium]
MSYDVPLAAFDMKSQFSMAHIRPMPLRVRKLRAMPIRRLI